MRLGLYELLFSDGTPDHAAVDQAVELVKAAEAAHAAGFVNAVLRRAARERAELTAALLDDDSTPEAAAVAHSVAALAGADVVGGARAGERRAALLAACNEPAEIAMRVDPRRGERERERRPGAAARGWRRVRAPRPAPGRWRRRS